MRTTNIYREYLNNFWSFLAKVVKAIVSGIPSQKSYLDPDKESKVFMGDENFKPDYEKHYHKPISRPAVEKQTLQKEAKKTKGSYKKGT